MPTKKNMAIWVGILGSGIAFFFLYGMIVDLMR